MLNLKAFISLLVRYNSSSSVVVFIFDHFLSSPMVKRTEVSLASLSRFTSLPSWRSRLRLTSMARRCSSLGLSNATWWTNAAMMPADSSRGRQTVATTTTLQQTKSISVLSGSTLSTNFCQCLPDWDELSQCYSLRSDCGSPAGGAAEQLAERRLDPAVLIAAPSRTQQELQVPEQQDAGLQGVCTLKHRTQLHLRGCRSVSTHAHTVHLQQETGSTPPPKTQSGAKETEYSTFYSQLIHTYCIFKREIFRLFISCYDVGC